MSLVATLICNPANPALDTTIVDGALAVLPSPGTAQWLFDEVAVDIPFDYQVKSPDDIKAIEARLQAARGDLPIDIVVQPQIARRKKLFLADMDSTMIGQECVDELAIVAGVGDRVAAITERAMRGELDFEAAIKERVGLLKGLDARVLDDLYAQRVTLMPGAQTLIATMRKNGAYCALVSGGFDFFTQRVAPRLDFDIEQANHLDIADGRIAGTVAMPILGREPGTQVFRELAGGLPYPLALQLVTDEEVGGRNGTLHQIGQGVSGEFVIIGEHSGLRIVTDSKGMITATLRSVGRSGHSAYPWLGDNALVMLIRSIDNVLARYPVATKRVVRAVLKGVDFCASDRRDAGQLCVVETPRDLAVLIDASMIRCASSIVTWFNSSWSAAT
jgi:phosphoserine phosphatase